MKLLVPWLRKKGFRGYPRSPAPKFGVFGVIWGQNQKIFKPRKIIYQNDALDPVIKKKWFTRSSDLKIEGIWGHLGSKLKNFKPGRTIHQN